MERAKLVAIGILFLIAAPSLALALPVLLAILTKSGKRHRIEALLGYIKSAHLAQTVFQRRDPPECVVDLPELEPLTLGQYGAHLAPILFGRQIAVVQASISAGVLLGPKLGRDFSY